jgi:hypothetical protein
VGISAKADAAQEPLSARQDNSKALDELHVKITGGVFWAIREAVGVVASAREIVTHKGPDELIEKLRKAKRAIEFVVAELMDAARRHHDVANEIFDDRVVGCMFLVKALQRMTVSSLP